MPGFETNAIHVGQEPDSTTGAVVPPITLSTTFAQPSPGNPIAGYDYARAGTPTRTAVQDLVNSLEGATHGSVFASGLAAEDAVLRLIGPNDHVLLPSDAYGGTFRLIDKVHKPHGLQYTAVDFHDRKALLDAWQDNTRIIWIESPTNPNLNVLDIESLAQLAHERGALAVVDNTFATSYLQQPLDLGADIVVHSLTKYFSGHSDVTAGYAGTRNAELGEQIYFLQKAVGAVLSPFDCYFIIRGTKTLSVRMEQHCNNAERIARFLETHPAVESVCYPGLESHPHHALAAKQMKRFGGMVAFNVAGGKETAVKVVSNTQIFALAESLGAVESLIEHPATMTHSSTTGSPLEVDGGLIRLSVGIETVDDLIDDLDQALKIATS